MTCAIPSLTFIAEKTAAELLLPHVQHFTKVDLISAVKC